MVKTPRKLNADIGYNLDVKDSPRTSQLLKDRLEFFKDLQSPRILQRPAGRPSIQDRLLPHQNKSSIPSESKMKDKLDPSKELQTIMNRIGKVSSSTTSPESSQVDETQEIKLQTLEENAVSSMSSCQASDALTEEPAYARGMVDAEVDHVVKQNLASAFVEQTSSNEERPAVSSEISEAKPSHRKIDDFSEIEELESLNDVTYGKTTQEVDDPKPRIILSGWLWTGNRLSCFPSISRGSWTRHFFVIVPGMLICYDDDTDCNDLTNSRYRIDLNAGICVKKSRKSANVIKVLIGSRTIMLKTEESNDTSRWQEALMEAFSLAADQLDHTLTLSAEAGVLQSHDYDNFISLARDKPRQIWTPKSKAIDLELRLNGSDR